MTFAEKLRELRTAKGLSQSGLAKIVGVTQAAIAHWESGKKIPAFDSVQTICTSLSVPCTIFDGCEHTKDESSRNRGRPKMAPAAEPTKGKKKGSKP